MRLFIALKLTEEQKGEVRVMQHKLKSELTGIKWVRPESMHLTLRFIGETDESKLDSIKLAIDDTAVEYTAPVIQYGGSGLFPSTRNARVLWIGLRRGEEEVQKIEGKLREGLAAKGFPPERRPYHPHLTIGRIRNMLPPAKLDRFLENWKSFRTSDSTCKELVLFQSNLTRQGAQHSEIHSALFKNI